MTTITAVARAGARLLRRYPVTAALVALLWLTAAATGSTTGPSRSLVLAAGAGPRTLRAGHWWSPVTSLGWCANLVSYVATTVLVLAFLPLAERTLRRATAVVLLVVQVSGQLAGCAVAALLSLGTPRWAVPLEAQVVLGPSGAVLGTVLVATAALPVHQRWRLRTVLVSCLAMLALYSGLLSDLTRLATGLVGVLLGIVWLTRKQAGANAPATPANRRLLVAVVVAVSAAGPLLAAFGETKVGPLWMLRYVFTSPAPDHATVAQVCADRLLPRTCAQLRAQQRITGIGPAILSVVPVLVLLAAAEGLRRGRRAAWVAALTVNAALAALGVVLAVRITTVAATQRMILGPGRHGHAWLDVVLPVAQPVLVVALLLATRRLFAVSAPQGVYLRWARHTGVMWVSTALVYVVGSLAARSGYRPVPSAQAMLADLPARFLPPDYLGGFPVQFGPGNLVTTVLYEWTGVVFWLSAAFTMVATFLRHRESAPRLAAPADLAAVRALLARTGGSSLAHLATWPGQCYWFTPDGRAAIAYRLIAGVAVTTGHPVGAPADQVRAVRGFVEHCGTRGWTPCLYSVTADLADVTSGWGWGRVQVAEEAVLSLPGLAFTGRKWQDVRTALNRAEKAGVTPMWLRYREAPATIAEQIQSISAQWLADKGLPEMGFTLGGLAELADDDVAVLAAVDRDGTIHAVTSWLPVHRDGVLVGRTLDFMRRGHSAFKGVMEFLIATAATTFRDEGLDWMSLSGAPLARVDRQEPRSGLQRALETAGRVLEPAYGFRSLLAFKTKFQPSYRPLYLAYPDPLALPAIGYAIGHAYLPDLTARQAARLAVMLTDRQRTPHPRTTERRVVDAAAHQGSPLSGTAR